MGFPIQKIREMTLQLLFSFDMGENSEGELISLLMQELAVPKKQVKLSFQKALAVWEKKEDFDAMIARISTEYALERIQKVEINVLRLALYERMVEKELDEKIIFSEAIRLCRKFSTPESSLYVNAILASSFKSLTL